MAAGRHDIVLLYYYSNTKGQPARRWLVYAHAPTGDRKAVVTTLPDFGQITVDVPVAGAFWVVDEKTKAVAAVADPR